MSAPAPVLLQPPPFRGRMPELGRVLCAWNRIVPAPVAADAAVLHPAALALHRERVGAGFWNAQAAPRAVPDGLVLVCAPPDPLEAAQLWQRALRRHAAGRLLLVLPATRTGEPDREMRRLGRMALAAGAQLAHAGRDPHVLLDAAAAVVVAAEGIDALSALALLGGLPVWRLAADGAARAEDPARALALLVSATRYRDPFTGADADAGHMVALLADWRRVLLENRRTAVCVGMSLWKRRRIALLFARADATGAPPFRRGAASALRLAARASRAGGHGGAIAVWSTRAPAGLADGAQAAGITLQRVEDGFIRSRGLGSDLLPPASVIVDSTGVYFDPSRPSDLETLLATHPFDAALRQRARRLIDRLVAGDISKYAAGGDAPLLDRPAGRRVLLVPGQVSDDLSVRLGGGAIQNNLGLLQAVRAAEPDAFIVFRPHPDVDAGHRAGAVEDGLVRQLADRISRGGSMTRLIAAVDEVHTLTSLAGFEALLRGRRVVTYGQPFYAGWGLTRDHAPPSRRTRSLSVEELAAATLILYPRYLDPRTGLPCGPEILVERLGDPDLWRPSPLMRLRRMQGRVRRRLNDPARVRPGNQPGSGSWRGGTADA